MRTGTGTGAVRSRIKRGDQVVLIAGKEYNRYDSGGKRQPFRGRVIAVDTQAGKVKVEGAMLVGSFATGTADEWSDIDLDLSIPGEMDAAIARWTKILYADFGAIHHWDLPFRTSLYRVFLLPDWLEVDLSFPPAADYGVRTTEPPDTRDLIGLAWKPYMEKAPKGWERYEALLQDRNDVLVFSRSP